MAIALAQARVTGAATPGTSVAATLGGAPTLNNLLVATCVSSFGPFTAPGGWSQASPANGANMCVAVFYRKVQAGDTAGPYTFTETNSDTLFLELEEWGGFSAGTISVDLSATHDQTFGFTSHSISPGSSSTAVELVKVAFGTGSSTAVTASWNQGISVDTQFVAHRATTGHVVTSAAQSFNPTTVSWLSSTNSSTVVIVSFYVGASGVTQLGTTGVGGLTAGIPTGIHFGNEYTAAVSGSVTDFQMYAAGGAADQTFVPVIYATSGGVPTTLVAQGGPVTVTAGSPTGWRVSVMSASLVSGSTYLLGLVVGDTGSGASVYYAASGTSHRSNNSGASGAGVHNVLGFYPGDGASKTQVAFFKAGGNGGPYVNQSLLKFAIIMTGNNTPGPGVEDSFRNATFGHFYDTSAGTWTNYGAGKPTLVVQCGCAFGPSMAMTAAAQNQALMDVANGLHDSAYQYFATGLVNSGYGNSIVRIGHEFDGTWYPWSAARGNAAAYVLAYRRVHDIIKGIAPAARYDWCSAGNQTYLTAAYPGDAYVDICGVDYYQDQATTMASRVPALLNQRSDFAIAHGKQTAVGEWGLSSVFGQSSGDDPSMVQAMYDWMVSLPASGGGSLAYQSYLLADPPGTGYGNIALFHFPNAQTRFATLFGP